MGKRRQIESLLTDLDIEQIVSRLVTMATDGNISAGKIILDRIFVKPTVPSIQLADMPEITELADVSAYIQALMQKLHAGDLDVLQFDTLTRSLHRLSDSMERVTFDNRLQLLENRLAESA